MNVIACGPSGAKWDGSGPSIGVNDYLKFGKQADALVCVNSSFTHDREALIRQHKGIFYSQLDYWSNMPGFSLIETRKFKRSIEPQVIYHSITSPLIAISIAHNQEHKKIVLWGIDFTGHPIVNGDTLSREIDTYMRFFEELERQNTFVYLGVQSGVFKNLIPCLP